MSGRHAGWRSHDEDHDDRGPSYGRDREHRGSSRWFGSDSHQNEGRYGGYEGERGDYDAGGQGSSGGWYGRRSDGMSGRSGGSYGSSHSSRQ